MQSKVANRNDDYATIIRKLQFGRTGAALTVSAATDAPATPPLGVSPSPSAPSPSAQSLPSFDDGSVAADSLRYATEETAGTLAAGQRQRGPRARRAFQRGVPLEPRGGVDGRFQLPHRRGPVRCLPRCRAVDCVCCHDAPSPHGWWQPGVE